MTVFDVFIVMQPRLAENPTSKAQINFVELEMSVVRMAKWSKLPYSRADAFLSKWILVSHGGVGSNLTFDRGFHVVVSNFNCVTVH